VKSVERAVWGVNKNQALTDVKTLEQMKSESLGGNRLRTYLLVAFAAVALLLAAIGLFGVISYTVTQRTHELGLRAALGASSWNLLELVVKHGLGLTAIGLVIGMAGSIALTHLMKSLLFEVSPRDPLSLALAGGSRPFAARAAGQLALFLAQRPHRINQRSPPRGPIGGQHGYEK
jgi:putative ABC transport system permease protein